MEDFYDTDTFLSDPKLPKDTGFDVPKGYFDTLPDGLLSRIKAKDFETKPNSFLVPDDYFKNLSVHIQNKISLNEGELIVPDSFFENQKESILDRIALQEKVNSNSPITVPDGYFAQLTTAIESKTKSVDPFKAKIFSLRRWVYAGAAVLILSFGIIYYSYKSPLGVVQLNVFNTDSLRTLDIVGTLKSSDIPEEELIKHIDIKELSNQVNLEEKDEKKILEELDESDLTQNM